MEPKSGSGIIGNGILFDNSVPVDTNQILDMKFRFKPELNRIFIITKIWALLCLNHCILPNNLLKADFIFFLDFWD